MSPVFRHGRLRLYLLKLLDEAPRHGYEIIRLLQDRFLGVYAPSPGTIYPRLARLEEEGLVTHDEADGRKVYRITDRGREELHTRLDDLAELEEEITASVRDIAREVSEDVRETVRNLREELTSAARDIQGKTRQQAGSGARKGRDWAHTTGEGAGQAGQSEQEAQPGDEPGTPRGGRGHGSHGWGEWTGWGDWTSWAGGTGWGGWPGSGGPSGRDSQRAYRDLERLARQFARELRMTAWHAQSVSEDALGDLRDILDETLERIRADVFGGKAAPDRPGDASTGPAPHTAPAPETGPAPGTAEAPADGPAAEAAPAPETPPGPETGRAPETPGPETGSADT
jgi:DNA-binding PadR family transcriptional regulator